MGSVFEAPNMCGVLAVLVRIRVSGRFCTPVSNWACCLEEAMILLIKRKHCLEHRSELEN